jgi:3-hydroxyacyl-CoA dehydrogenase
VKGIKVDKNFVVRKVAVLGAGVMGAQIAAHLVNANIEAILFDLPAKEGDKNGVIKKAIDNLAKIDPAPLSLKSRASFIQAANYDEHLPLLKECDLIIEAISERMDWKHDLYRKVAPHLNDHAIFASNTSGLSITKLSEVMPDNFKRRFCGIHFFNPPRYMKLVELIATPSTDGKILDDLETFLTTHLGKGVIRAKDTPNFIANRVGIFSMLATMHHAGKFNLGFDEVDAITGPLIGRAKSATFRTADVVGLDTMAHVIKTMQDTLPNDPWHKYYTPPPYLSALVAKGALGAKTKAGFFTKKGKDILVLDVAKQDYVLSAGAAADEVKKILRNKNPAERFKLLRESAHPQAQFLWSCYRDMFHYAAVHLQNIADNARDLDLAIRWGFGYKAGPFETWQAAGWEQVAKWMAEDIAAGKAMSNTPLPAWVLENGRSGVHTPNGSFSPATHSLKPRSTLPVYKRQLFPETVLSEGAHPGTTIYENDGVRMWHTGDNMPIVSFKSKMHAVSEDVLDGLLHAIDLAEKNFDSFIIWQPEPPFSVGADLSKAVDALMAGAGFEVIEKVVAKFQQASQRLRYSLIPTVAAVDGMALGGGCEFPMHCDRTVTTMETYMGLVEVGVGLLPAGGGCKEMAMRAAKEAKGGEIMPFLSAYFKNLAMGEVSKSAEMARDMGFLRASDVIVMNANELLYVAKQQARAMAESGYRPPLPANEIPVVGKTGLGTIKMMLVNMRDGGFISNHDFLISSHIAEIMCGGEVESGSLVNEKWLLDLERKYFIELGKNPLTQARIGAMLETGKPLRN